METNREVWSEYRRTWKAFTASLDAWQQSSGAERPRLEELMEQARVEHKAARDRLAERLSSREHRVRNTAKMIWELSGKPEGSADSDWFLAEKVWK